MRNHEVIARLREAGMRVYVRHVTDPAVIQTLVPMTRGYRFMDMPPRQLPKVATHVQIVNEANGLEVAAVAMCSVTDEFNRRIGLTIALGRATKQLAQRGVTV